MHLSRMKARHNCVSISSLPNGLKAPVIENVANQATNSCDDPSLLCQATPGRFGQLPPGRGTAGAQTPRPLGFRHPTCQIPYLAEFIENGGTLLVGITQHLTACSCSRELGMSCWVSISLTTLRQPTARSNAGNPDCLDVPQSNAGTCHTPCSRLVVTLGSLWPGEPERRRRPLRRSSSNLCLQCPHRHASCSKTSNSISC